jgi:hypothetical protein
MDLTIGVVLLAVTAVLLFVGLPNRNGDSPRFLQFEAAVVVYPPLVMAAFVLGVAEVITGLWGIR